MWLRYLPHLAVAVALGGGGWWAYSAIKEAGRAECRAQLAEETAERQAALDERAEDLLERALELERAEQVRSALERDLSDEASQDPMADDPGLGIDSLRRLNRIR